METSYTVTLARAHKLQDRLNAKLAQLGPAIGGFRATVSFSQKPTPEQLSAVKEMPRKAAVDLEQYLKYSDALAALRAAIGEANATAGVNRLLAQIEASKRNLAILKRLSSSYSEANASSVHVDSIVDYAWPAEASSGVRFCVDCSSVSEAEKQGLTQRIERLERHLFQLQDSLADKNTALVEVRFEQELAEFLGLAKS